MTTKSARLTFRIAPETKAQFLALAKALDTNATTLLNLFVDQTLLEQGLPFRPTVLPTATRQAPEDANQPVRLTSYPDAQAMLTDLGDDAPAANKP